MCHVSHTLHDVEHCFSQQQGFLEISSLSWVYETFTSTFTDPHTFDICRWLEQATGQGGKDIGPEVSPLVSYAGEGL